jgi:DNA-binding MarR family transcriptional regulator
MTASIEQTASDADGALIQSVPDLLSAQPPDPAQLRQTLSALRRQLDRPVVQRDEAELRHLTERVQDVQEALAELRVQARTKTAGEYVKTSKVRASVLRALASGPATPTAIADQSCRAAAVVSRALKQLRNEDLVTAEPDPDDKRQLIYDLTDAGEAQAAEIVAFTDAPAAEPSVDREVMAAALREALDAAVTLRRHTGECKDVLARLKAIADHARRAKTPDVHVQALNEILTTLRQDGQTVAYEPELGRLEEIATGKDETIPARFAFCAVAHLEYQLGRHPNRSVAVKAGHLVAAHNHFRRLADDTGDDYWRSREAWAHAALADNYRQQSTLDAAVVSARAALSMFKKLDDPYGLARCHFMLGFCMRLMGRFEHARQELLEAKDLTDEHGFRAFGTYTLMQLGEVYRCLGQLDQASTHLSKAREQATDLRLTLTGAFADTALAATMHQQGHNKNDALKSLDRAQDAFAACHFDDGLALSLRRRSVVLRERSATAANLDYAQQCVDQARKLYTAIMSPAGIAACHIEDGLLAAKRGRATNQSCTRLVKLCKRPMMGYWIERDPWVPIMLRHFAEQTGHEELKDVAAGMLIRNAELTSGSATHGSDKRSDETNVAVSRPSLASVSSTHVDHMGGEHRRVSVNSMAAATTDDVTGRLEPSEPLEIEWRFA